MRRITKLAFAISSLGVATFGSLPTLRAQQPTADQIQTIKETAASVCNTVNEAKGRKSDSQIQGEVNAQMKNLLGKVFPVGGSAKGSLTNEQFEGLSQEATAAALEGDRGCRERVFDKMFDRYTQSPTAH
jgi:hypothetical protein